jgi:hypothetical protein
MPNDYFRELERDSMAFVGSLDEDRAVGRIIAGHATHEEYARFLAATYQYVHWSGFLLAKTAEALRKAQRCPFLVTLVDAKSEEESPHDAWALNDLRNLGVNAELVKGAPLPHAIRAYLHFSLVLAEGGSPAFLGAAYTLELISMHRAKRAAENLRRRSKIPNIDRALTFLEGHGDADLEHVARLAELLREVSDGADQAAISFSASALRALYPRFFYGEPAPSSTSCHLFA